MERKKSVIKHMLQRILFSGICVTLLICSFVLPASAAVLDYNDYITNIQVDGDNDLVSVSFPIDGALFQLEDATTSTRYDYQGTSLTHYFVTTHRYRLFLYPIYPHSIDYSNIPNDTQTTIHLTTSANGMYVDVGRLNARCWFNMYGDHYSDGILFSAPEFFDLYYSFNFTKPSGATSGNFYYDFDPLYVSNVNGDSQEFTITLKSFEMTFSISSLYRLQQQSGKTNVILKEVEKQLADQGKTLDEILQHQQQTNDQLGDLNDKQDQTNNKLDGLWGSITEGFSSMGDKLHDLFTGGSAGDKVTGSAGDFKDQLGDVEDFQSGVESDLEAGFDEVLDFSGLASLAPAFAFIGTYVNKIWYDMDGLQVVFVLAFGIGAFLQLAQHTPRVPVLRSQDRSSRTSGGGRNSNWYDPVSGRVVDGNRERGQARANRGS